MARKLEHPVKIKKIFIARNEDKKTYIHDEGVWDNDPGELALFYDTPERIYDSKEGRHVWDKARKLAELPQYMFPNVTFEKSPAEFILNEKSTK